MAIRVNGELVPSQAVVTELTRLVHFYKAHLPEEDLEENRDLLIRKAKDQAIGARLLLEEARKAGVKVTEGEVAARRTVLVREAGGEEAFEALMDSQGIDEEEFRQSVVESLMIDKLVKALVSRIAEPTEGDVDRFLAELQVNHRPSTSRENAFDLLVHERRGHVLTECVAMLRKKAVVEDDEDLDGADIDALFDEYLSDEGAEKIDESGEE